MSLLTDLLGAGGSVLAGRDIYNRLQDIGTQAQSGALAVGREAQQATEFKPFTVTTGFGGLSAAADGSTTTSLSPQMAAQQQALQGITGSLTGGFQTQKPRSLQTLTDPTGISQGAFGQAAQAMGAAGGVDPGILGQRQAIASQFAQRAGAPSDYSGVSNLASMALGQAPGMFEGAMGGMGAREADIYERIRATQRPEEQRAQMALEERLASQGRTGLRTAQFGGSPEQLAMEKARAEAMNQASLAAMGQAGVEQERQFGQAQALSQLGLGATQAGQALGTGDLQNLLALQQADIGAAQAGQGLRQGQLGLASGMFGLGTQAQQLPYQLRGLQQGLESQRLANIGAGMGLTGQQLQNIGTSMGLGYMPEQQLLASLTPGLETASMADVARRQGAGLFGEAGITGLEARLGAEIAGGETLGNMYQSALAGLFD